MNVRNVLERFPNTSTAGNYQNQVHSVLNTATIISSKASRPKCSLRMLALLLKIKKNHPSSPLVEGKRRSNLQQHISSCCSSRGEALLSFRRAPRGLALRRCRTGITTQQRLRSPPPGILGPRPLLLMITEKMPSQCIAHASKRTRVHAPL
mgnify:CR=1 FL=1